MVKAEDMEQTWRDVAGLNAFDTTQWITENLKDLPAMLAYLLVYAGLAPKENVRNVIELPACEFCGKMARFRGKTGGDEWHDMCEGCFAARGEGFGSGIGHRLELVKL